MPRRKKYKKCIIKLMDRGYSKKQAKKMCKKEDIKKNAA